MIILVATLSNKKLKVTVSKKTKTIASWLLPYSEQAMYFNGYGINDFQTIEEVETITGFDYHITGKFIWLKNNKNKRVLLKSSNPVEMLETFIEWSKDL
jgi:hypothetical protein